MDDTSVERRLRHLAKASGFNFKKSTTSKGPDNRGGYQLFETATNAVVDGIHYELDLRAVAIRLQRLGVLGGGRVDG
ncbi:hypothetical protein ACTDI4_18080 [Mesorhizobium sp. PUT5]|uniref:hypothetical protein n=1 Tax=Mesorhizobium sp. PUT5 TaxID=3454629 RepID=UPI003FA4684F